MRYNYAFYMKYELKPSKDVGLINDLPVTTTLFI